MTSFSVAGVPATQGSKKAFPHRTTGRIVMVEQAGEGLRSWREAVAWEARRACSAPISGPVRVQLDFVLAKPASAPKTKRTWPVGKRSGDVDKLARAVLDALTGVVFVDDSQVVDLRVFKDYPSLANRAPQNWTGVTVHVREAE